MPILSTYKHSHFLLYIISSISIIYTILLPIGFNTSWQLDMKIFGAFDFTSGIAALCASISAFIFYWATGKRFFLGPVLGFGAIGFFDLIYSISIFISQINDNQWPEDYYETSNFSIFRIFLASLIIWSHTFEREYESKEKFRIDFSTITATFIILFLPMMLYGLCYMGMSFYNGNIQLCTLISTITIIIACYSIYKRFLVQRDYFSIVIMVSLMLFFWAEVYNIVNPEENFFFIAFSKLSQLLASFAVFIGFALQITDEFKRSRIELHNREMAEEKLRTIQFQQTAIYDNIPYMSYLKDFIGNYVLVNKAFEDLCGYPQDYIIGKDDDDLWNKEISTLFMEGDQWVLKHKQQLHREIEIEILGEKRWFDQYKTPIFDDHFNVTGSTGILVDITSRKEYEKQLKKQQAMLSKALMQQELLSEISISFNVIGNFSQIVKYILDLVGNVIYSDRMFILERLSERKWYSWCSSRTRSQSSASFAYADTAAWQEYLMNEPFINSDEIDFLPKNVRNLLQKQKIVAIFGVPIFVNGVYKGCIVAERFDKKQRWNKSEVELLRTTANIYASALERKEIISSLSRSEKATKTILDAIPDSIFHFKSKGTLVYFKTVDNEFGKELQNANNKSVFDIFPNDLATKIFNTINKALDENGCTLEFTIERNNFIRNYEARFIPISDEDVIAIMRNVSQRKEYETQLKIAKQKAEQASKAKSEFLANMSHEIRTPLNAILGFSEILLTKIDDQSIRPYLNTILVSGKTLLSLINDILDLSKIEAGRLEIELGPISIRSVVNEIKQIFLQKSSEKGVDFITNIAANVPQELYLDEIRIRQILFNLVGNAIKFTDDGFVRVDVIAEQTGERHYRLEIKVSDSGIGISNASLERIFEAFLQQSGQDTRKYGGTGLGLAITKKLVEKMNGNITVESEAKKGSVFTVIIEYVRENSVNTAGTEEEDIDYSNICFEPAKIMIIDDVEFNIFALKGLINDPNLNYLEADSGEMALDLLQHERPDLIFLDLRMDGMDGYQVNYAIRNKLGLSDIPIIAFTASAMKSDLHKLERQFDGILLKPVERIKALEILKHFLPYKALQEDLSNKEEEYESCQLYEKTVLADLLDTLENKLYKEWEEHKSALVIFEIEDFVEKLKTKETTVRIDYFTEYVTALSNAIVAFDIETIERLMNEYDQLIVKTKKKLEISNAKS